MSALDSKTTYRNLLKKGFISSNSHHKFLDLYHNGKLVLSTKISHDGSDLRDPLIKAMSFQCKLSKNDFIDLAKCPLSKDEYFEILEKQGLLK